jgi:hypothetical protein
MLHNEKCVSSGNVLKHIQYPTRLIHEALCNRPSCNYRHGAESLKNNRSSHSIKKFPNSQQLDSLLGLLSPQPNTVFL